MSARRSSRRRRLTPTAAHLTLSWELDGTCPFCGGQTVLVVAPHTWNVDREGIDEDVFERRFYDGVDIEEEISGHYCDCCDRLVSLSFNRLGE